MVGLAGALGGFLTTFLLGEISARLVGRRMLAQYPVLRRVYLVDWNAAGLRYRDDAGDVITYSWSEITDAERSRDLIMLYLGPRAFLVLPMRLLDPAQTDDLWARAAGESG